MKAESESETRAVVHQFASRQHGVVSRKQLLVAGVSHRLVEHWSECQRLFRIFTGVYALGRPATDHRSFWMAAVLRAGASAVLSGSSAAALWGLVDPRQRIEVSRATGHTIRMNSARPHSSFHLLIRRISLIPEDLTSVGPIPVIVPARVLIQMAGEANERNLRRAFLNAGRSGHLTRQALQYITARSVQFKGHARLMGLVDQWLPETGKLRSPMESEFLLLCGKYGIPRPRTNHRLGSYEADCFWPGTMIVAELDSRGFHDDGFGFEDDREKGNALSGMGYTVLRFTHRMITERPEEVARILRQHLVPGTR